LAWYEQKQNLTQQKQAFANQNKSTATQNKQKTKHRFVASYNIRPGNGEGLFWFWHFINLTPTSVLKTFTHLLTVPDGTHTGHELIGTADISQCTVV